MLVAKKCPHLLPAADDGFTLIELLFTIAVMAIFSALAAPAFGQFVASQRVKTAASDLSSALMAARSEAMKRNLNVALEPVSSDWKNGWTLTAGGTIISRHEAVGDLVITGPAPNLTYNSSGRLTAGVTPFSVSSSTAGAAASRCINIELSGLPRAKLGACT